MAIEANTNQSKKMKQSCLSCFIKTETQMLFVEDSNLKRLKSKGVLRRLILPIHSIVEKHPEGIMDDDLVSELATAGYKGDAATIHRAGKKLVDKGRLMRKEWIENVYYSTNPSKVKRYKYY